MEIQQLKDPNYLNDFEKKHLPLVTLPEKIAAGEEIEVQVKIGEIVHPMMPEHYITWVALYDGEKLLVKNKLKPNTPPETSFRLKIAGNMPNLRCLEECNIHGIWETKINLVVS